MRTLTWIIMVAGALGWAQIAHAQAATQGAPMLPEMVAAVERLDSPSFTEREKAVATVEQLLLRQLRALAQVADPEAAARVAQVAEVNEAMSRWLRDVLTLRGEPRAAIVQWSLQAEICPTVVKAYALESPRRVAAVRALAKQKNPEATWLLGRLILDEDRAVSLAAMEAVWDRPATATVVDALWARAIDSGVQELQPRLPQTHVLQFRGRQLEGVTDDEPLDYLSNDQDIATEVLAHLQAPRVAERLGTLWHDVETKPLLRNDYLNNPSNPWLVNACELLESYKPRQVVPVLMRLATIKEVRGNGGIRVLNHGPGRVEKKPYYWSNRLTALAMTVRITGQSLEEYKLERVEDLNKQWTVPTQADEQLAVTKLQTWWQVNQQNYDAPPTTAPASQP